MRPIAYALQFRGVAAAASPETPKLLTARATAPSGALRTIVEPAGIRGALEPDPGDEAVLEARIVVGDDGSFAAVGSITFGVRHVVRFRTLDSGHLDCTPDPHLRHGGAVAAIEGGSGQFEGATGRITSNFLVSDTGELTDHQVGVVFVRERGKKDERGRRRNRR